ncbi:MAG: PEGA domain-containing protein [Myxococcales bacterium]|nr:PEGA domain-containing protein [Myxococcales bacterium]
MKRTSLFVLSLAFITAAPSLAFAGDGKDKPAEKGADEASERFRAGVAFYKSRDFEAALVEFKRAYELEPNYRVLFNLGQTSQELNDYASALKSFRQYLSEGGKEVDAARQKKVSGWIEDLEKKVATVTIETNAEGAEILVDDVVVGKAPLDEPVIVNAGRRKLAASAKGYTPTQRVIDFAGSDEKTVSLELVAIEKDRPPPPPPPLPPPPATSETEIPVAAWVVLGLTGAGAVTTAVLGGLAVSARGDLDEELARFPGNAAAIEDAQSKTKTLAIATDVLGGLTVAGAVTTGILFGVALSGSGEAEQPEVTAFVTPTGVVLGGSF